MSDSDEYNSAKDEDVNPLADADDNSSDEEPLKKKSRGRPKSVAKAKTTPKKVVKSKKGKKTPQKATPIATKKGKRVKVELIPAEEDSESEEEEYEVESIVGHREYNGKHQYKIRWKNYEAIHDTWEDYHSLSCPDLLEVFNIKHDVKINSKLPKGRPKAKAKAKGKRRGPKPGQKAAKKRRSSVSETSEEESDFEGEGDGEVDGEEEYEVDKIVEVRVKKDGTRDFMVHWKRWSSKYDSWEPEANLSCPDLIEKFMERVEKAKNSNTKELRENRKHTDRFTLNTTENGRRLSRRNNNKQRVAYFDAEESE